MARSAITGGTNPRHTAPETKSSSPVQQGGQVCSGNAAITTRYNGFRIFISGADGPGCRHRNRSRLALDGALVYLKWLTSRDGANDSICRFHCSIPIIKQRVLVSQFRASRSGFPDRVCSFALEPSSGNDPTMDRVNGDLPDPRERPQVMVRPYRISHTAVVLRRVSPVLRQESPSITTFIIRYGSH